MICCNITQQITCFKNLLKIVLLMSVWSNGEGVDHHGLPKYENTAMSPTPAQL